MRAGKKNTSTRVKGPKKKNFQGKKIPSSSPPSHPLFLQRSIFRSQTYNHPDTYNYNLRKAVVDLFRKKEKRAKMCVWGWGGGEKRERREGGEREERERVKGKGDCMHVYLEENREKETGQKKHNTLTIHESNLRCQIKIV